MIFKSLLTILIINVIILFIVSYLAIKEPWKKREDEEENVDE